MPQGQVIGVGNAVRQATRLEVIAALLGGATVMSLLRPPKKPEPPVHPPRQDLLGHPAETNQ